MRTVRLLAGLAALLGGGASANEASVQAPAQPQTPFIQFLAQYPPPKMESLVPRAECANEGNRESPVRDQSCLPLTRPALNIVIGSPSGRGPGTFSPARLECVVR
jgi:hypothetical protein